VTEELKFIPGKTYLQASPQERTKLIFSKDWDIREIEKLSEHRKAGRPIIEGQDENLLYRDVWLLEKIAETTGFRFVLLRIFSGDKKRWTRS